MKFIEKIPLDRENFVSQSLLQKKMLTTLVQIIYLLEYIYIKKIELLSLEGYTFLGRFRQNGSPSTHTTLF